MAMEEGMGEKKILAKQRTLIATLEKELKNSRNIAPRPVAVAKALTKGGPGR